MINLSKSLSVLILLIVSFSFACNKSNSSEEGAIKATLHNYTGLDGCSWVITLDTGEVLEPVNLADFPIELKEGKKIWIVYTEQNDLASICMVGPIVRLDTIWER